MLSTNKRGFVLGMFLGLLLVFSSFSAPISAEEIPSAAKIAAKEGLLAFLKAIPAEELEYFNFAEQGEVDQAKLGDPFMIYTISPDQILNYAVGTDVESIITPTNVWLFPVISNGAARTLLTMDFMDGNWRAVSIGGSGVAKEWDTIIRDSSVEGEPIYKFVRIYQAVADLVLVSDMQESRMVPLKSACISLELEEKETYEPSKIILGIQETVRQNLEIFKTVDVE